jgi:hypothetical protein
MPIWIPSRTKGTAAQSLSFAVAIAFRPAVLARPHHAWVALQGRSVRHGGHSPAAAKPTRAAVLARSKAADEAVLALIRSPPNLKTGEIARAIEANVTTTSERLRRLAGNGKAVRDDSGGWAATSSL